MAQALAAPTTTDGAIRVNLTLPVTRIGVGFLSFDPLEQLIGCPLSEILESLMVGPVFRRPSASGPAVEVYPLALPDGEGACIPLGQFGETGFRAERGLLVLTVPWAAQNRVLQRFGEAVVAGPEQEPSSDGSAWVAAFKVRLKAGMRASWPLGGFGEVGVEAG